MKNKILLVSVIASVFSLSAVFYSCGKGGGTESKQEPEKKLTLVKVKQIETTPYTDNYKISGTVKPFASAKVSSEEGGLILNIPKDKGSYVSKGEMIVYIKKDVEIATFNQTAAQVELAKMNYEKQKELYEENATTEIQYLTAKWQLESAEQGLNILRTRLKSANVRAPISGVIDDKFMNKGEMSAPGSPILSILDISRVKISAGVPESYITQIKNGQSVNITVDVLPGMDFEGRVNYIAPALNGTSRSFEIEVVINNRNRVLKPGMTANVQIAQFNKENAVVIPQDVIIDYGEEQYVFVLEGDIAKKRDVKIGGRNGNDVLIDSGLNPGEKLIIEGFQSVKDGEKVQIGQ
jgi:membrane fusion protein (multidrug efflux system)